MLIVSVRVANDKLESHLGHPEPCSELFLFFIF